MIKIELSKDECQMIERWYENMRERAGHWGDGAATFPDDDIVIGKLETPGKIEITPHHLGLVVIWAEGTLRGSAITPAEYTLLTKVMAQLGRSVDELGIIKPQI